MMWETEPGFVNRNDQVTIAAIGSRAYAIDMDAYLMYCLRCKAKHRTPHASLTDRQCPECGPGRRSHPLSEEERAIDPVAVLSSVLCETYRLRDDLVAERGRLRVKVERLRAQG